MNKVAQKRQSIPIIGGDQIHLVTNFSKVGGGAWEVVFVDPDDAVDNAASYEQKICGTATPTTWCVDFQTMQV